MVKHVVCMNFNDEAQAPIVKEMLCALVTKVPSIASMEVGIDFLHSDRSFHLVLITTHEDIAALNAYRDHPAHKRVQEYIKGVRDKAVAVDFEI